MVALHWPSVATVKNFTEDSLMEQSLSGKLVNKKIDYV